MKAAKNRQPLSFLLVFKLETEWCELSVRGAVLLGSIALGDTLHHILEIFIVTLAEQ